VIVELLAQTPGTPTGPEFGKASPLGLAIVLLLLVGTFLLVRSMNRHLKNLPPTFEPEHPEPDQAADEGTEPGAVHPVNGQGETGTGKGAAAPDHKRTE